MSNRIVRGGMQAAIVTVVLSAAALSSQMDPKFAQAQSQNAQELKQYAWKSRTEVQKGGETRNVQLNLMRYDIQGALQKTLMSSTPQQQLPQRGLRGRIAQKKKEGFVETLQSLEALARSYSELRPEDMQRLVASATVTPEMTPQRKLMRANVSSLLQPGDSMTVWIDAVTRKMRKVEIQTTLERERVSVVSEFQDLPNGPTYMARSVIHYPSEQLTVITENFDYERVSP